MEVLIIGFQALEDLDGVLNVRLIDIDLLEPAHKRAVLFEVLAKLLIGGRAHAAQRARSQGRLQQIGRIHGPARRGTGPDDGMDLVDEQYGVGVGLQLLHHLLDPLFEITAIAGPSQKRAHIQAEYGCTRQDFWHFVIDDLAGQALGNRRLANARITDQQGIILGPATQDLDGAVHLGGAADQGVHLTLTRLLIEIDAIGFKRIA